MSSPKKNPRKSLAGLFEDLNVGSSAGPSQNANLIKSLRMTLRKRFPHWGSVSGKDIRANFTIKQDSIYDYYSLDQIDEDPDELFEKTQGFFEEIQEMVSNLTEQQEKAFESYASEALATMIFGSNFIEMAGSTYDITLKICLDVLAGKPVPEEIPDRDPEYLAAREHLRNAGLNSDYKAVVRSRKEIIQHAQALKYIVTQLVIFNNILTEEIIQKTHHILCNGIALDDGKPEIEYAGLYRTVNVIAGFNPFMPPGQVPMAMRMMVAEFNNDVTKAENDGVIDPFSLAAKYCHKFVNIHPFVDGNGRTCRLILNAVLLKYAGIVISLGDQDSERYMEIATKASIIEQMDEEERDSGKPAWSELASHVILKASEKFQTFRNKLRA